MAIALLSSACAAGQQAQTANEKNSIDGANSTAGTIDLRALAFEAPTGGPSYLPGSDAVITGVIVNSGQRDDTLTSITSPSASGWGIYPQQDAVAVRAAASQSAAAADSPSPSDTASTSASTTTSGASPSGTDSASTRRTSRTSGAQSSSTAAASSTAVALPAGSTSVSLTAGNRVAFGTPDATKVLLLRDLRNKVYPGTTLRVTFTFARAGDIVVQVPVQLTEQPATAEVGEAGVGE